MIDSALQRSPSDRRHFLRCSACSLMGLAALTLPACGGEPGTAPVTDTPRDSTRKSVPQGVKFEIVGSQIRVFIANVPELVAIPSAFLIEVAQTIVIRTGALSFNALTAVCTHVGCTVSNFSGGQLICPCHGSAFDLNGNVLVGPAVGALAPFNASFDSTKNELLITKGA